MNKYLTYKSPLYNDIIIFIKKLKQVYITEFLFSNEDKNSRDITKMIENLETRFFLKENDLKNIPNFLNKICKPNFDTETGQLIFDKKLKPENKEISAIDKLFKEARDSINKENKRKFKVSEKLKKIKELEILEASYKLNFGERDRMLAEIETKKADLKIND